MIHIPHANRYRSDVIDIAIRALVPTANGVSTGPYGTLIHLPDGTSNENQDKASNLLNNVDNLTVTASVSTMTEGDADPIVTCNDPSIASDPSIGYIVLLDGTIYASGSDTVSSGTAQLTLSAPVAGVYDIFLYRLTGNYASGSVRITVNEV